MSEISRLRWLCRRGMKELDVVMSRYLDGYYAEASSDEQELFRSLLAMPDPELYDLLLGRSTSPDIKLAQFIKLLRNVSGNVNKEC